MPPLVANLTQTNRALTFRTVFRPIHHQDCHAGLKQLGSQTARQDLQLCRDAVLRDRGSAPHLWVPLSPNSQRVFALR